MHKKLLLLLVVVFWPSYSYSESIAPYYGYTGNAITDQSLRWSMPDILPDPPGLYIDNVLYQYRIDKETDDLVSVYVYNETADGSGYIFRDREDWQPGSLAGTQITKVVPLGRLHRDVFGDGGIEVEGPGSVYEPNVVYTYRVEPCYDPQFDPNCPGYKPPAPPPPPDIEIYDAIASGDADQEQYRDPEEDELEEEELTEEELAKLEEEEKEDREMRLEAALFEAGRAALFAEALAKSQLKDSVQINMNNYYAKSIPGGEYKDTVSIADRQMPDAKNGLRNGLAQQLLHQQMVEMQYKK